MEQQAGPSSKGSNYEPGCENCFISNGDLCICYFGKVDLLLALAQRHGVILAEKRCPKCKNLCRLDCNKKTYCLIFLSVKLEDRLGQEELG